MSALGIGAVAGLVCSFMVLKIKKTFGYDDSLDAFGVHGMGGTVGAVLTGVLASGAINAVFGKDAAGNRGLPAPSVEIGIRFSTRELARGSVG